MDKSQESSFAHDRSSVAMIQGEADEAYAQQVQMAELAAIQEEENKEELEATDRDHG